MSDPTQKSTEELVAELKKVMSKLKSCISGWRAFLFHQAQDISTIVHPITQLVLAQQEEIEQLKAELRELKKR